MAAQRHGGCFTKAYVNEGGDGVPLLATETITVVHRHYDGALDKDIETRTVVENVSCHAKQQTNAGASGLNANDVYQFRFFSPTIEAEQLTPGSTVLYKGQTLTILAVHDNRRGVNPHWYVEAS